MGQKRPHTIGSGIAIRAWLSRWGAFHPAFIVLLLLFIAVGAFPAHAHAETVRIGYFESEKYGYIGADGDLRGYDVQLSKTIGMYSGFDADMRGYDNVPDMEEALRTGEVDALIDFLKTDKREQEFIFTNSPILEELVSVYSDDIPNAPIGSSAAEIEALRIGYVSDSGFLNYFMDYCTDNGISPQLVAFHDEDEMHSAMDQGKTDACMTGSAVPTGYKVLLTLPPLGSYLMLRAGDESLRNRIDSAIAQIRTDNPDYISNLYHLYVASHNKEMSPLTSQEREYLAKHPVLSVAIVRGAEPFVVEKDDGTFGGVILDYYRALEKLLGVTFSFVAYDKTQDAIDAVSSGETDILGHYYGDIILAERDGLYDTMEYGSTECARLTRSDHDGKVQTAAVTDRTAYLLAEQLDADIKLETDPNLEACYQALMRGDVDAMIGSMTGITWLINQHTMRGVSLSILPDVTLGTRGAVSRDDSILLFVLNKAIAVSGGSMNEVIIENAVDSKTDLRTALENLPLEFTVGIGAALTLLVILLIVALVLLARSSRDRLALLHREMNVDSLTGAGSRRFGAELLSRELLLFRRYGDGPMLAMLDIDHFKEKNDTLGHEYGDFVLKQVVEVIRAKIRKSDTIIRWGGDEFILLFPRTQGDDANRVLEKVVTAISSADFSMNGKGQQVTISVGASFFQPEDLDITPALRRCDSALYEAKTTRNTYHIFSGEDN